MSTLYIVEGFGGGILGKSTVNHLNLLRVGPPSVKDIKITHMPLLLFCKMIRG